MDAATQGKKKFSAPWLMLLVLWGGVLFYSGWVIRGWQKGPEPAKSPSTTDYETHVVLEHGNLMPCLAEVAEYSLRIWAEENGRVILEAVEPFRTNQADGVARQRRLFWVRGIGKTGQPFAMQHYLYRSFPQAVEYDITWEAVETDSPLKIAHRLFAQTGCSGSKILANNVSLHWELKPFDKEAYFREMSANE